LPEKKKAQFRYERRLVHTKEAIKNLQPNYEILPLLQPRLAFFLQKAGIDEAIRGWGRTELSNYNPNLTGWPTTWALVNGSLMRQGSLKEAIAHTRRHWQLAPQKDPHSRINIGWVLANSSCCLPPWTAARAGSSFEFRTEKPWSFQIDGRSKVYSELAGCLPEETGRFSEGP